MTRILGIDFAPLFIPWHRRLETLAVVHFVFVFLGPYLTFPVALYMLLCTNLWWLTLLYAGWFYVDMKTPRRGSRPSPSLRRWPLWRYLAKFFPIQLVKTAELDPNRNYIFGYHPHGIMSFGAFVNFATEATGFSDKFPGITSRVCTLVGQFWFPLRREYIIAAGCIEVSKESIKWIMQRPRFGQAVVIVIGGAVEALNAHPGSHTVVLSNRLGFVRTALIYGADLVPVFCFGENDVYFQYRNPEGSLLRRLQVSFKNIFGFSPPIISGRGIFNYSFGLLPFRRPLYTVVGKPIRVDQCGDPTPEQVHELHRKYTESLLKLFNTYKVKYSANPEGKLTIQ